MKFLTLFTPLEPNDQHIVHINVAAIAMIEWYADRASRITLASGATLLVDGSHAHLRALATGEAQQ